MTDAVITTYSGHVKSNTVTIKQMDIWLYDVLKRAMEAEKKIEQQSILITEQSNKIEELSSKIS